MTTNHVLEVDASSVLSTHTCDSEDPPLHPPLPLIEEAGGELARLGLDWASSVGLGLLRGAHLC